jgi:hypothetical protein
MEAARAEFEKWRKRKDFEDEQISRARRMRIPAPMPDRMLALRYNGAWVLYQQAKKEYEALKEQEASSKEH